MNLKAMGLSLVVLSMTGIASFCALPILWASCLLDTIDTRNIIDETSDGEVKTNEFEL